MVILFLRFQIFTNTSIQKSKNMTIKREKQFLIASSLSQAVWIKLYQQKQVFWVKANNGQYPATILMKNKLTSLFFLVPHELLS